MKRKIIRFSGLLIIAVLLIVGLGGCYADPEDYEDVPSDNVENATVTEDVDVYKYAVVSNEDGRYIIGRTADGGWQEITKADRVTSLIGFYDNRLYFCDDIGLAYIDINSTDFSRISWMDHPSTEPWGLKFSSGMLVEDTVYFNYDSFEGGQSETDGILTLKLTDTSFDDAIQLIAYVDFFWQIEEISKTIYYLKNLYTGGHSLCSYDLATGSEALLYENVNSFSLYNDGMILYSTENAELYLHNTKTGDNQLIFDNLYSYSGTLWSCADYRNGDVYYKDGDQIIKYNNGNRDVIYTYSYGDDNFYGFEFFKDNIIELILQSTQNKYLINGEVADSLSDSEKVSVVMSDGTTALFERLSSPM